MTEELPKDEVLNENEGEGRQDSVYLTRHSKAKYGRYKEIVEGETPEQALDAEDQPNIDLPEEGIELAKEKAEEFFNNLDSEKDVLFFASSNERRALDTANIYREKAKEKGFEIIVPENVRGELADEIGDGEIRTVQNLSLNLDNVLISSIFNPDSHLGDINWDAVDEETREKWDRAREIIDGEDKGSWGANFFEHSEAIKEIFPEDIQSAEDVYNTSFKNIMKLVDFGLQKAKESEMDKNIKILGFGHENYLGFALDKYFGDNEIGNCESIHIQADDKDLVIDRRGETQVYDEGE